MSWFQARSTVSYQTLLVGGFALLASAVITIGDRLTRADIAERQAEDRLYSLRQVIPSAPPVRRYCRIHCGSTVSRDRMSWSIGATGRAHRECRHQVIAKGYSGDIVLVMGVAPDGKLLGVRVVSHSETPGLGDKLELAKSDWILSFNGRSLIDPQPGRWAVKKDRGDFDQWTGATITPER
ncbi:MAG: RnfABCDGE type electron transport complex subunit G [Candidatus Competibacteraceae bacterium]